MHNTFSTTILPSLSVPLSFEDLARQLHRVPGGERLLEQAEEFATEFGEAWSPAAVLRTLQVAEVTESQAVLHIPESGQNAPLALGWSSGFLTQAKLVIVGGYTVGKEVQKAAAEASGHRDYLKAYLIEQMGLALLAKTGSVVNEMIESIAGELTWGVGPLLSPGSVHGWELTDQTSLCRLLPLADVGMNCSDSGVLSPFNSLTFLVGLGPGYQDTRVGSPCTVCNNRQNCHLRSKTS